ncbi:MAG: Fe-S cluster assembly protein SufD [Puniceicoccaceae bacterium]
MIAETDSRPTVGSYSLLPSDEDFLASLEVSGFQPSMVDRLRVAWKSYQEYPSPRRRDEAWRFSSRPGFYSGSPISAEPPLEFEEVRFDPDIAYAGEMTFIDGLPSGEVRLSGKLRLAGVVFCPLTDFYASAESDFALFDAVSGPDLGSTKYDLLNQALASSGFVLKVPQGLEIEEPFLVRYHYTEENRYHFARSYVQAGPFAKVNLLEAYSSTRNHRGGICSFASRVHVQESGQITRKVIQDLSPAVESLILDSERVERDGRLKSIAVHTGSSRARYENVVRITGSGAEARLYSLSAATGKRELDQRTLQIHDAPHAFSDLLFKNALLDQSRTIFSGLIQVATGAQQTDAYQTNRNLLLDPTAIATALPGLEIEADDVKCSHGATTGRIDEEEIFYMMQRGISRRVAQELAVAGFFEEVVSLFDIEEVREVLRNLLKQRFHE